MKIKMDEHERVVVNFKNGGGYLIGEKTIPYLLYAILEKLEEIRCGVIDVEDGIQKASDRPYSHK